MADSTIVVSDANDVDRTLRTDEVATVHTPHHTVASTAPPALASTSTLQSTSNTSMGTRKPSHAPQAGTGGGGEGRRSQAFGQIGCGHMLHYPKNTSARRMSGGALASGFRIWETRNKYMSPKFSACAYGQGEWGDMYSLRVPPFMELGWWP